MILKPLDHVTCPACHKGTLVFHSRGPQGGDLWKCPACDKLTWHRLASTYCGLAGYSYPMKYQSKRCGHDHL